MTQVQAFGILLCYSISFGVLHQMYLDGDI